MVWRHEARYPVKIHKLAASLFKLQGSKRVKNVATHTPEITVLLFLNIRLSRKYLCKLVSVL